MLRFQADCRKYNFIYLVSYVTANNDAFYTLCTPAVGYWPGKYYV